MKIGRRMEKEKKGERKKTLLGGSGKKEDVPARGSRPLKGG